MAVMNKSIHQTSGISTGLWRVSVYLFLCIVPLPILVYAHTTTLIPHTDKDGRKTVKVLHFHPSTGSDLMGIRLNTSDSKDVKGLGSIFVLHDKEKRQIHNISIPDHYIVRGEKRETYSIPIKPKAFFSTPGDYVIVISHQPHLKKHEGIYRQKVAKFYLNYLDLITDWPNRLLDDLPEIIPLVPPHNVYAGSIFRAEAVDDNGNKIPHAKIQIEFLNYPAGDTELNTEADPFIPEDLAETIIYTDNNGSFSFIPHTKGIWTFTLLDGDSNKFIKGKRLEHDSSLSISVKKDETKKQ